MTVVLTGLDIEAKAAAGRGSVLGGLPVRAATTSPASRTRLVRTDKPDPATNEEAVALLRITREGPRRAQGRAGVLERGHRAGARQHPRASSASAAGPAAADPSACTGRRACRPSWCRSTWCVLGGDDARWSTSRDPAGDGRRSTPRAGPGARRARRARRVARRSGRVVGARSGDKGGNANLGVFARSDEAWAWLDGFLTVERLRALLPEAAALRSTATGCPPSVAQLRDPRPARGGRRGLDASGRRRPRASASGCAPGSSRCPPRSVG